MPPRLGNMLKRPSLLLQPQEIGETVTKKERLADGQGYTDSQQSRQDMLPSTRAHMKKRAVGAAMYGGMERGARQSQQVTYNLDWMAQPAALATNCKPEADGSLVIPYSAVAAQRGGR